MTKVQDAAKKLAELHASGETLVLPTVWDVWSAKIAEDAGFKALTIGSHPVANSVGAPDGEKQSLNHYFEVARGIINSVSVPVSVDVESGYGLLPEDLAERVIEIGAAGINIEDTVHGENGRVRGRAEHAAYIKSVKDAADYLHVDLVINGRTDAIVHGTDMFDDPLSEAVERAKLLEEAGARSVYPVGLKTADEVKTLVDAVSVPVNVTADPLKGHGAGNLEELKALGVRRITFGPLWQNVLAEAASEQLKAWL
ncbi:MAG: isocitrate lyase/phosphoenolpyruvate mutase family protein [Actinomycetaceae bacterium]|nr:isocitrate lyase/phosphoenolpyruvate mutase family protein [Arcanobacterium sp.]MDD7504605.1 isocitrate lyase/phosphoenolpyruvate mutase family protein [Actinomycetaceae bacterium]MDY6143079.1 isocitrate lyase/phosphoenolpyruvate mutase family protein [Arcanobacterium sp.]